MNAAAVLNFIGLMILYLTDFGLVCGGVTTSLRIPFRASLITLRQDAGRGREVSNRYKP